MKPKVTVIIPTFNRAYALSRSIDSVLSQTYKNVELIVVDDGSIDETQELLKSYPEIIVLSQKNAGVSSARNLGIEKATGEYVAFLDSDDEWLRHKLEYQIDFLINNPNYKWLHSQEIWIRNGVQVNQMKKHKKGGGDQFVPALDLCFISPSTVLMHISLLSDFKFREDFPVCEDYDLWLKLLVNYHIGFLAEPLIKKYGGHEDQLSFKYFAMDFYRIKSIRWVLDNMELDDERRFQAQEVFKRKIEILKKGALKHQNQKLLSDLKELAY